MAGSEALAIGRGGVAAVSRATGLARTTVQRGVDDVRAGERLDRGRVRRAGAGRPPIEQRDPTLRADLEALIEPTTRGDPESPLRWTTRSVRNLAAELRRQGHAVSHQTVAELLHEMGYSLQANRKTLEGTSHPDRDAQFRHINGAVQLQLSLGEPVICVDTKKKELVGPFRNGGRELRPKGDPERVLMHDFVIDDADHGRVSPYGVYDLAANEAWVSVGRRPRHGGLRGREHPPLVDDDGPAALPGRDAPAGHRRRRRQQRRPAAAVEAGAPEARRRDRPRDRGLPLPAGHQQVEQDRAPAVLAPSPRTGGASRWSATRWSST